jgi:hypothetical protein
MKTFALSITILAAILFAAFPAQAQAQSADMDASTPTIEPGPVDVRPSIEARTFEAPPSLLPTLQQAGDRLPIAVPEIASEMSPESNVYLGMALGLAVVIAIVLLL